MFIVITWNLADANCIGYKDFYGSTSRAFENASRSDLRYFIEMQNSTKRHIFFPIALPVTYSRAIVAFNCIYQLPEAA